MKYFDTIDELLMCIAVFLAAIAGVSFIMSIAFFIFRAAMAVGVK